MIAIGNKGNNYFIICTDTGEAYMFDMFGTGVGCTTDRLAMVELNGLYTEVDVLSVVGDSIINRCEVLFNGEAVSYNDMYLYAIHKINKNLGYAKQNSIMYSIQRKGRNSGDSISQVLLVFRKGEICKENIENALGIEKKNWYKVF